MLPISSISLFRGYAQDNRASMEIYASHLAAGLKEKLTGVRVREIVPRVPGWTRAGPRTMRLFRYLIYPWQAQFSEGTINHVTEAGYSHLIRFLDPSKTLITVHDIIPLLSWRGLIPGLQYAHRPRLFEHSLSYVARAAGIITPSQRIKDDLVRYSECRAEKIHVIHHGIGGEFRPRPRDQVLVQRRRFGLPADAHLILISGDQAYKNHDTCLQVLRKLRPKLRKEAWLVRVGWPTEGSPANGDGEIIDLGRIGADAMPSVYNAVDALLFPSWYEGFGWPPLEAMACGVPVVASTAGSIPEIVGNGGYLCAPDDVDALRASLRELLEDRASRAQLIEKGRQRAGQFTWQRNIDRVCEVYSALAGGGAKLAEPAESLP